MWPRARQLKEVNRKENGHLLEKSEMKEGRLDAAVKHNVAVRASIVLNDC